MTDYNININANDNTGPAISRVGGGLGGLTAGAGRFRAALGAAGAALAAMGAVKVIGDQINQMDDLAKSARAAGAAASEDAFQGFQVMRQAMGEAGIDAGTFDRAMLNTTQRLQKGAEGAKGFSEIFDKLGPSIQTANGELKEGPALLEAMVNGLNAGTISTDEFAKVVGGRAGPLIQQQFASLNTSAEALSATLADVEANSNIVSLDAANNAEVFNDTVGRLKQGMGQLMTDAITPLLPLLVQLAEDILAGMPAIIESVKAGFDKMQPVLQLLGTLLTEVVVPIVKSLVTTFGEMLLAVTPLIEQALPHIKDAFNLVMEAVKAVYDALTPLIEASLPVLQTLFEAITTVLGTVFGAMETVYNTALPALQAGFTAIQALVETLVGWFNSAATAIQNIYNKAMALKDGVTGAFSSASDSVVNSTRNMYNGATGWATNMYDEWVGNSIFPDLRDAVIQTFQQMAQGAINNTGAMANTTTTQANGMAGTFQNLFSSVLPNALSAGQSAMGGFSGFFQNALSGLTSKLGGFGGLLGKVFGGGGGGGGGIGGLLGGLFGGGKSGGGIGGAIGSIAKGVGGFAKKIFGGFFANGGYLPAGQFGIAGEAGPEIITGPARVMSNADSFGGGGGSVSITINAIDTQTGTEFLLNNKKQIESIIQGAYNKRGQRGIY